MFRTQEKSALNMAIEEVRAAIDAKKPEAQRRWQEFNKLKTDAIARGVDFSKDAKAFERLDQAGQAYDAVRDEIAALEESWAKMIDADHEAKSIVTGGGSALSSMDFGRKWAANAVRNVRSLEDAKAFVAGGGTLPPIFDPRPITDPRLARFLSELLPKVDVEGTDQFAYWKQTTRTDAAAPVADLAAKPVSTYTLTRVDAGLKTVAHVTEQIPRHWLFDSPALQQFLDDELRAGLATAIDDQVLNGSGAGANMTGILQTAGIQTQALGVDSRTDAFRKAITKIQTKLTQPDLIVLNENDWQDITLEKDANGNYIYGPAGSPFSAVDQRMWGVPVFVTPKIAAGTGIVGAFSQGCRLYVGSEGVEVRFSEEANDNFTKNAVVGRCETRANVAVTVASLFVSVTGI